MKNKHFLFSISLAIAIAVIMVLSIFIDSTIFDVIAQVITIPFLLFTVVSCALSVEEEIVSMCNTKFAIENEKRESWIYYKETLENQLGWVHKYDNPSSADEIETNKLIDNKQKELDNAQNTVDICALNCLTYIDIIEGCERNKILSVSYVVSLTVLIVSMMIAPIVAPYCSFLPTTTLTLLSLFFAIMEALVKDKVAKSIFANMYKKKKSLLEKEKTEVIK